jgi:hypothetical protein
MRQKWQKRKIKKNDFIILFKLIFQLKGFWGFGVLGFWSENSTWIGL